MRTHAAKIEFRFDKRSVGGSAKRPDALYSMTRVVFRSNPHSSCWKPGIFRWFVQIEIDEGWTEFDSPIGTLLGRGHPKQTCITEDTRLAIIAADMQCPGVVLRIAPDCPYAPMFKSRKMDQLLATTPHFEACIKRVGLFLNCVNDNPKAFFADQAHRTFFLDASMVKPVEPVLALESTASGSVCC